VRPAAEGRIRLRPRSPAREMKAELLTARDFDYGPECSGSNLRMHTSPTFGNII